MLVVVTLPQFVLVYFFLLLWFCCNGSLETIAEQRHLSLGKWAIIIAMAAQSAKWSFNAPKTALEVPYAGRVLIAALKINCKYLNK